MFKMYKEKRDQIQTSNVFTLRLFSQKMQVSFKGTPPTDILLLRKFWRHQEPLWPLAAFMKT